MRGPTIVAALPEEPFVVLIGALPVVLKLLSDQVIVLHVTDIERP
jgi:hypothetical protein